MRNNDLCTYLKEMSFVTIFFSSHLSSFVYLFIYFFGFIIFVTDFFFFCLNVSYSLHLTACILYKDLFPTKKKRRKKLVPLHIFDWYFFPASFSSSSFPLILLLFFNFNLCLFYFGVCAFILFVSPNNEEQKKMYGSKCKTIKSV